MTTHVQTSEFTTLGESLGLESVDEQGNRI